MYGPKTPNKEKQRTRKGGEDIRSSFQNGFLGKPLIDVRQNTPVPLELKSPAVYEKPCFIRTQPIGTMMIREPHLHIPDALSPPSSYHILLPPQAHPMFETISRRAESGSTDRSRITTSPAAESLPPTTDCSHNHSPNHLRFQHIVTSSCTPGIGINRNSV